MWLKHAIVCTGIVLSAALFSHAADDPVVRNDKGERIWDLTTYLKGTSQQVHDGLCKEVHEYQSKLKELQDEIDADTREMDGQRSKVVAAAMDSVALRTAQSDVVKYKALLDAAHQSHDVSAAMDASKQYNDARQTIVKITAAANKAGDDDKTVATDRKFIQEKQKKAAGLKKGLDDAIHWHDGLVDAIRNTYMLKWPVQVKQAGNLGEILPKAFTADGDLVCNYDVQEDLHVAGASEGVQKVAERAHPVVLVLHGAKLKDKDVSFNHVMRFDHSVEVKSCEPATDDVHELRVVVEPKHDDVDELLNAIAQP